MRQEIHWLVIKLVVEAEMSVVMALLGVYSAGDMEIAHKPFDHMPNKDFFTDMQLYGLEPNRVATVGILLACAYVSALQFGKQIRGL
ncbi:hypothetical protein LguiB_010833 [Lonicera macranthoides]